MKGLCAILPPALLLMLAACGDTPAQRLDQAQDAFARQDFETARRVLVAGLRDDKGNPAMLTLLLRTQLYLGNAQGAQDALAQLAGKLDEAEYARFEAERLLLLGKPEDAFAALQPGDDTPAAWRVRAAARLMSGDEAGAVAAFTKGMAAGADVDLATDYARYLLRNGEHGKAAAVHRTMARFAPGAFETMVLEGDLAVAHGDEAAALAAFRRVVAQYPQRHEPLLALAAQLEGAGNPDEAMALVERAQDLAGDRTDILEVRVRLLAEREAWQDVRVALLGREGALDPASDLALTYGEALLRLGQPEQARSVFTRARLLRRGDPYVQYMLGEAQLATNDASAAWRTLRPLAQSVLAPEEIIEAAARAAEAVGSPEAADLRTRLQPAILRRTTNLIDRAQDALDRQDWAHAVQAYQAIPEYAEDPAVLTRLAYASSRLGRHQQAIAFADRALGYDPKDAGYLHMAGLVRLQADELAAARPYLIRAVEAAPQDRGLRRDLERAQTMPG